MRWLPRFVACWCCSTWLPVLAFAGSPADAALDRLTAGYQAQMIQDDARAGAIAGQIQVQDYIRWQAGLPDRWWLFQGGPDRFAPGARPRGALLKWWLDDGVFEPWPQWAGDIHGFRYDNPIEQPSGHLITPTGPNSYTYQPTYDRGVPKPEPAIKLPDVAPVQTHGGGQPPQNRDVPRPPAEELPPGTDELELAIAAFRSVRYEPAVVQLDDLLADFPDHGPAWLLRSQARFGSALFDEAASSLRRGMELLPADQWGLIVGNYDDYYDLPGTFTRQLRTLEDFVRAHPDDPEANLLLGYQYGYLGYPQQAAAALDRAANAAPGDRLIERLREQFVDLDAPADGPREF
jgi:tetratricopeptide (TPR) repeat protein